MHLGRFRPTWPLFPGPVFRRELGSAARGGRFYLIRMLAASALAAYVGSSAPFREVWSGAVEWSPGQMAELATRAFRTFGNAQFVLVVALVPLLVAGSIAEEKASGTLGLLLACRLGSMGIVADKLAARLLMVLVLVVSGVPVLALVGLLGGVDPVELVMVYGMTLSAAWFAACLSMLVSVHTRSAVGAVVGAYAAMLAWLAPPVWLAARIGPTGSPRFGAWLRPVARCLARSSPLSLTSPTEVWGSWVMTRSGRTWMIWEMAGLQVAGGLVLFALAAWRLRPMYRSQVGGLRSNRLGWLVRLAGLRGRSKPPCGDDPMAWKERHAPESAWLARLSILVGLGLVALAVRFHAWEGQSYLGIVFDEMFTYGLDIGTWGAHGAQRAGLNTVLCEQAAILFTAGLTAATILAAAGIAGERGRGTWAGLLGTPLDRRGILRAKMWGAVRPIRVLLGMMVFFYLASLAATALHPVGLALAVTASAAYLWFAVALGTWVSVRSKDANQAIGRTVILLAAINFAPVAALSPYAGPQSIAFATPMSLMFLPLSRMHFRSTSQAIRIEPSAGLIFLLFLMIILAHAVGAWFLTRSTTRRIERDEG